MRTPFANTKMGFGPQKIDRVEKMRLEDKNNSQKMIIEYFANTKSVFAGFPCVRGMSEIVFGVRKVFANKRKSTYKIFVSA